MNVYDTKLIPVRTQEALNRYMVDHLPAGDFLEAVMSNDLRGAFSLADPDNLAAMPAIVGYVFNHMPVHSIGSKEKVKKWLLDKPPDEPGVYRGRVHSV